MDDHLSSKKNLTIFARIIIIVAILACAVTIAGYWLKNRPRAERRLPEAKPALVRTMELYRVDHQATVRAMGTVVPSQAIALAARVGGTVVRLAPHFLPGGRFSAGEEMLLLDPTDYKLAVEQRRSDVVRAEYELSLEQGRQAVARREYELLGETVEEAKEALVLREPHLKAAQAALLAARAALAKAELDLARTRVIAPFNGVIEKKYVGQGSQVTAGTTLASLVDTDAYWVEIFLPQDQLSWLSLPDADRSDGLSVRIYNPTVWGPESFRAGTIKSVAPAVDPQSKMAGLLIAIADPLCLNVNNTDKPRLAPNAFVSAEIAGKLLRGVYAIPRDALREGRTVWIITPDNRLDIRPVTIIWSEEKMVFVSDRLTDGDQLVTSALAAPVQGMEVRREADQSSAERR